VQSRIKIILSVGKIHHKTPRISAVLPLRPQARSYVIGGIRTGLGFQAASEGGPLPHPEIGLGCFWESRWVRLLLQALKVVPALKEKKPAAELQAFFLSGPDIGHRGVKIAE